MASPEEWKEREGREREDGIGWDDFLVVWPVNFDLRVCMYLVRRLGEGGDVE